MAAEPVFLDTSGWIAILNRTDDLHPQARVLWPRLLQEGRRILLTDWVIAETGNSLARTPARASFSAAVDVITSSPRAEVVTVGADLRREALALYASHSDKRWGLIDCASFAAMRRRGILEALTADRDFQQAGFTALLA